MKAAKPKTGFNSVFNNRAVNVYLFTRLTDRW